jgi:RNA polymerase sporulation-specific sigma factor
MIKKILDFFKKFAFFTTSYSINVFPEPLSAEDEERFIFLACNGDKNARNELIEHNLRLVAHIVKKFESFNENTDDLISIGTIGLIKGIDTYNPNKPVKLITYAAKCIENEILMYIRQNRKSQNNVSLNDSIGYDKDGNEITLADVVKEEYVDSNDVILLKDNVTLLKKYIGILNKREKDIIIRRYGLLNQKEETQREIAKELGISRSYVSRIEKRALVKLLREFIKNNNV